MGVVVNRTCKSCTEPFIAPLTGLPAHATVNISVKAATIFTHNILAHFLVSILVFNKMYQISMTGASLHHVVDAPRLAGSGPPASGRETPWRDHAHPETRNH